MKTETDLKWESTRALRTLVFACLGFCVLAAGAAQAAPLPAPGLKVLAVTAPTHLPPRQSEVQRVTVEGEGGSFALGARGGAGKVTPVSYFATISATAGSPVATIESVEGSGFEVGERVFGGGLPFEVEAFVVSCSPDCRTPGSTVTFSEPAEETVSAEFATLYTRQLKVEEGEFHVGEEIKGTNTFGSSYFYSGTAVMAVEGSTVTLSKPPTQVYGFYEHGIDVSASQATAQISYDASPAAVQSALEAMPALGVGSVTVTGGPGGDAAHPYYLAFGGSLADRDVPEISVDEGGLEGEHHFVHVFTTVPGGVGTGEIVVLSANIGGSPSSGVITAKVGPLPQGIVSAGKGKGREWHCPGGAGETTITCTSAEPLGALHSSPNGLSIPVEVGSSAVLSAVVPVELYGGGSPLASSYQLPIFVSKEPAQFGVAAAWAGSFEADGSLSTQAGGHPYDSAAYVMVNSVRLGSGALSPAGDAKNEVVDLPPGFVGNPLAGSRCPQSLVVEPKGGSSLCNQSETVGNLDPIIGSPSLALESESRLFNDIPPKGFAAEFSTVLAVPYQSVVANVNSEEDFGVRLTAPNNPNYDKIYGFFAGFEGVPVHGNSQALLTNPVNCAESAERAPVVRATADTFQEPGSFAEEIVPQPALVGCQSLSFKAFDPSTGEGQVSFGFQPTSTTGSTPVGATAHLHIDQRGLTDPTKLATPELKRSVIQLPAGLSLNPSAANGLESCSEAQIGYRGKDFPMPTPIRFNEAQPTCPDGSKLGTAEIKTPLLDNPLVGTVYLSAQEENPFGSLLAIYFVVNDPLTGVLVKVPGEVQADPMTGRLTAVFDDTPQLPFDDLILNFRGGGPRSEFATSEVCGNFSTEGEWTPWSAPESGPSAMTSDSFSVTSGCSSSPAARPFSLGFQAGTISTQAGGYSPLVIKVNRKDGEQELTSLNFTLSPGLVGSLAGIPRCSDAAITQAAGETGRGELVNPSCPAASRLGTVDAAAGVGSEPVHVGGSVYLAGPYKGAPISSVAIIPAVAGPFDLGDVVVRAPVYIDPETAVLTVKTDPIPTILRGIPLKVQSVALNIDRPDFIFNPTNCDVKSVSAAIAGNSGATASPTARFQVGGCVGLAFKPRLSAATNGKTSRTNGASLDVKLTYPKAPFGSQANIKSVRVELPKALPSRLTTLNHACADSVFNQDPAGCPPQSRIGFAKAVTPVLSVPLEGPAYFVSHGGQKFPELVMVLQGEGITIDLAGETFISNAGITSSTFKSVPDVPVGSFELNLPQGPFSALGANTDLCAANLAIPTTFDSQNGATLHQNTQIEAQDCPYALRIVHHSVKKRTLTLKVSVPQAGRLVAGGEGVSRAAKTAKGHSTLTLTLKENHAGKLRTKVQLRFTPIKGTQRKILYNSITVTFH